MKITNITTLALSRMHGREEPWMTAGYRTVKAPIASTAADFRNVNAAIADRVAAVLDTGVDKYCHQEDHR